MFNTGWYIMNRVVSFLSGTLVFLLISALFYFGAVATYRTEQQTASLRTMERLGAYRARLEGSINSRLASGKGLATLVGLHDDYRPEEFRKYSEQLVGSDPVFRNVALLKDTTIIDVYPVPGNEKALGVDLLTVPAQAGEVLKAKQTGLPVVSGPVDLVQGGKGIISRIPISLNSTGDYWGQVSVVLNVEKLFEEVGLGSGDAWRKIGLRLKSGEILAGVPEAFGPGCVVMTIPLPNGMWELGAIPDHNPDSETFMRVALVVGLLLALASGLMMGFLVSTRHTLKEMAYHDPLTGLPNRLLLVDRLASAMNRADRSKLRVAVVMMDLDGFKLVNDRHGHGVGDAVLAATARKLAHGVRVTDTVARLGGDEFLVILADLPDRETAEALRDKVIELISGSLTCEHVELEVAASSGLALYPDDGKSVEALFRFADAGLYDMKMRRSAER